ncbi:Uncharacterised protein [Shigella sonnei]|nr:Uncharacterised protein [Shigella sonnei]
MLLFQRNKEADNYPRQGCVNPRFQHRSPQHHANKNIDARAAYTTQIQYREYRNCYSRDAKRGHR